MNDISVNSKSRDVAVVRALASHQCGLGSIPGPGVICGLSLLLVLVFAHVAPRTPVFPSPQKTNTSKFQFDLGVPNKHSVLNTVDT